MAASLCGAFCSLTLKAMNIQRSRIGLPIWFTGLCGEKQEREEQAHAFGVLICEVQCRQVSDCNARVITRNVGLPLTCGTPTRSCYPFCLRCIRRAHSERMEFSNVKRTLTLVQQVATASENLARAWEPCESPIKWFSGLSSVHHSGFGVWCIPNVPNTAISTGLTVLRALQEGSLLPISSAGQAENPNQSRGYRDFAVRVCSLNDPQTI